MKSEFLPEAEEEFREAAWYYEKKAPGVGLRFIAEVRKGVSFITENPYAAVDVGGGIRRKVLNHFPHTMLYAVESELVVIVAVAHQKRRPRYWHGRLKELKRGLAEPRAEQGLAFTLPLQSQPVSPCRWRRLRRRQCGVVPIGSMSRSAPP